MTNISHDWAVEDQCPFTQQELMRININDATVRRQQFPIDQMLNRCNQRNLSRLSRLFLQGLLNNNTNANGDNYKVEFVNNQWDFSRGIINYTHGVWKKIVNGSIATIDDNNMVTFIREFTTHVPRAFIVNQMSKPNVASLGTVYLNTLPQITIENYSQSSTTTVPRVTSSTPSVTGSGNTSTITTITGGASATATTASSATTSTAIPTMGSGRASSASTNYGYTIGGTRSLFPITDIGHSLTQDGEVSTDLGYYSFGPNVMNTPNPLQYDNTADYRAVANTSRSNLPSIFQNDNQGVSNIFAPSIFFQSSDGTNMPRPIFSGVHGEFFADT